MTVPVHSVAYVAGMHCLLVFALYAATLSISLAANVAHYQFVWIVYAHVVLASIIFAWICRWHRSWPRLTPPLHILCVVTELFGCAAITTLFVP